MTETVAVLRSLVCGCMAATLMPGAGMRTGVPVNRRAVPEVQGSGSASGAANAGAAGHDQPPHLRPGPDCA